MDVDSCARTADMSVSAEGLVEMVPLEMYDSARAKIAANLRWLFAKAYGIENIPEDLRDPFYTDQYEQEHIKPPVIHLLLSSELYCRVYSLILETEQAGGLQSHLSVIHALHRKGIYVVESDDTRVTDEDLSCVPIKMSAHIPMIDALMMAYTVEMISIEKVVTSVKKFSTFSESEELPFDLEDAMVFWINKVNLKMREVSDRDVKVKHHPLESPSHQKVRYRREHGSGRQLPFFPLLEDLSRDVCDGAALLTVVHFYCSDLMKLEDICLKKVQSIADSLYNIQLLREFSNRYLQKSFYLTTEDVLYSPLVLKHNLMVFIAELFWWFETVKPEFVRPRDLHELKDARSAQPRSSHPSVPISNATKRSFLTHDGQSSPEVCNSKGGPPFSPSHPLLPLRQKQQNQHGDDGAGSRNRSNSLSQMEGHPRGSVVAWPEKRQRPVSTLSPFMLHSHTDGDADVVSGDSVSLARSISKDSLASTMTNATPKHQTPLLRKVNGHALMSASTAEDEDETLLTVTRTDRTFVSKPSKVDSVDSRSEATGFYLEPLVPATLKPAKEKSVCLNKEEESGEGARASSRGSLGRGDGSASTLNRTFSPSGEQPGCSSKPAPTQVGFRPIESSVQDPSGGFYLQSDPEAKSSPCLDPELEEDLDEASSTKGHHHHVDDEEESAKLKEDMNVKEHEDKDVNGCSGRSSPCLSSYSQASSVASSVASSSVRMTSFAERKAQQQRFGSNHDLRSSASSSQRTTPDGSESSGPWRFKRDQSPSSSLEGCNRTGDNVLASEIVQLRMQLEEKRRAIEHQKKKMEVISARQRQKLGKAAFLHIVKRGGRSDALRAEPSKDQVNGEKRTSSRDDPCVEALRGETQGTPGPGAVEAEKEGVGSGFFLDEELDLNECNRSIERLSVDFSRIQEQMKQLSVQQEMLMKQPPPGVKDSKGYFVDHSSAPPTRKPPKLSSGRSSRSKPSELKISKEQNRHVSKTPTETHLRQPGGGRSPRTEPPDTPGSRSTTAGQSRSGSFRLHDDANMRLPTRVDLSAVASPEPSLNESEPGSSELPGHVKMSSEEAQRRAHLIEVDLSELRAPEDQDVEDTTTEDGEQKSVLGFFFKDEQKAEDELAKKRAAFLLKQQKKAEEARVRKQQLEAESELKREETRRKAEEDRLRKEEEKTRRELIKQGYMRRKEQEKFEEQVLPKPKTPKPKHKHKPRPVFREEPSSDNFSKCPSTHDLSDAQSGSNLSLASGATNEADSVNSGGGSQRCDSVESFPGSRGRAAERDWDNGSTASSITSMAEYTGPKLFKEPSAKSNKPIIHNAVAHCCLAGKVNEPQKNQILEELEKCESNHFMILFRDGGCQFRALYSYFPDTEEIQKLTGTGPKAISKKMIDKLYKYNSDRKQFTVIPAKTVSVSVDALTIHNQLWQVKRGAAPKKNGK